MIKRVVVISLFLFNFLASGFTQDKYPLPCLDKKITIIAHVIRDNNANFKDSIIFDAVDTLNSHFSKICVSFEVCDISSIENYQYDFIDNSRESLLEDLIIKYRVDSIINIFFVEDIESSVCGRSTFKGIDTTGFIVIKKECVGERNTAIIHEMGHYFGLEDTYAGNGNELVDGSNCATTGDKICDTPSDPNAAGSSATFFANDCRYTYMGKDANGDFYDPDVSNMMSAYPCRCRFSDEQYRLMVRNYLASNPKTW